MCVYVRIELSFFEAKLQNDGRKHAVQVFSGFTGSIAAMRLCLVDRTAAFPAFPFAIIRQDQLALDRF